MMKNDGYERKADCCDSDRSGRKAHTYDLQAWLRQNQYLCRGREARSRRRNQKKHYTLNTSNRLNNSRFAVPYSFYMVLQTYLFFACLMQDTEVTAINGCSNNGGIAMYLKEIASCMNTSSESIC
jgi:hypothetical protein